MDLVTSEERIIGHAVISVMDSVSIVAYFSKEGETVSQLCQLTQGTIEWTELHSVQISTRYI